MLPPSLANILTRLHDNEDRTDSEDKLYRELLFVSDSLLSNPLNRSILHEEGGDNLHLEADRNNRKKKLIDIARIYADGRPVEVGPKVTGCDREDCKFRKDWT